MPKTSLCVGTGGVGKTTIACILGLHYAHRGEKTLIITIDPARRLLDTLGISNNSSSFPHKIDVSLFPFIEGKGELYAFMPDLKSEWQSFLQQSITSSSNINKISSNHFYEYMIDGLPGAFEIICCHILFKLQALGIYDRIILDTPPSSHSLSFFDVPKKLIKVLDNSLFRRFLRKRSSLFFRLSKKLAFISSGLMQKTMENLVGNQIISELVDFAFTINELYEPLLIRAKAMEELLKHEHTNCVLVLKPTGSSLEDSLNLKNGLNKRGIYIDKLVFNQVMKTIDSYEANREWKSMVSLIEESEHEKLNDLVSLYTKSLMLEKTLINQISNKFPTLQKHIVHISDAVNRYQFMSDVFFDYERQV